MDLININDLKDGEVLFFNIKEEDKPRILEFLKNRDNEEANDGEVEVQQADLPFCEGTCNTLVPFCITSTVPSRTTFRSVGLSFDASCVECVIEPCLLPVETIPNPCPGQPPITGCDVPVNRVRAVGCIRLFLNTFFTPDCGVTLTSSFTGTFSTETVCVDNILCFTCNDAPCPPNLCTNFGFIINVSSLGVDPCGNEQFTFAGFIDLPRCVTP